MIQPSTLEGLKHMHDSKVTSKMGTLWLYITNNTEKGQISDHGALYTHKVSTFGVFSPKKDTYNNNQKKRKVLNFIPPRVALSSVDLRSKMAPQALASKNSLPSSSLSH